MITIFLNIIPTLVILRDFNALSEQKSVLGRFFICFIQSYYFIAFQHQRFLGKLYRFLT